jgi:hypothetical protein
LLDQPAGPAKKKHHEMVRSPKLCGNNNVAMLIYVNMEAAETHRRNACTTWLELLLAPTYYAAVQE